MSLTRTQIRTLGRKFANDTDATNPFWSDTDVNVLLENWQSDMASYLRWPRGENSVVPLVVGQYAYDFPADWLSTIRVIIYDSDGYERELIYRDEDQITCDNPNWRNDPSSMYGTPRFYFAANTITPGTALSRKLNVYPLPEKIRSMLLIYVKNPTAIAADANVPIFPAPMHILAVYYLGWQMNLPLNLAKAQMYETLYKKERNRMCGEGRKESEKANIIVFK